jgi:hypothetical protein
MHSFCAFQVLGRRVGSTVNRDFDIGDGALFVHEPCDVEVDRQIARRASAPEDPDWKRSWSNDQGDVLICRRWSGRHVESELRQGAFRARMRSLYRDRFEGLIPIFWRRIAIIKWRD